MAIEIILLILGLLLGILTATLPYRKGISNEERLRWGAMKP